MQPRLFLPTVAVLCCAARSSAFSPLVTGTLPRRIGSTAAVSLRATVPSRAVASSTSADADGLYCLNVKISIKPERREEFIGCIEANQKGTLTMEPLALTYLWGEDDSTPNTFHFFEQYRGREGFVAHTQTPHFADWETFVATEPFSEPPAVTFYTQHPGEVTATAGKANLVSRAADALKTGASLGGIIVADMALRRLFRARAIPFPSTLAGMLLLFGGLCSLQAVRPAVASKLEAALMPGCAFISRWLALFFVPNLVVLPLVLQMSASEAARLLLVIVAGLAASIPLAALTAQMALPKTTTPAEATQTAPVAAAPTSAASAAPPPAAESPLPKLVGATFVTGVAAAGSHWLVGGAPAAALAFVHLLTCTVCGYIGGQKVVPASAQKVVHPLIMCTLVTLAAIASFAAATASPLRGLLRGYLLPGGAPFSAPGNLLLFMLGPATVSFGFQMFGRRKLMAASARAISAVVATSSVFGLFGTALAGRLLKLSLPVRLAAIPRQVTAPLAIAISGMLRCDPSLAATIVVITGLLAANFGRAILDALNVREPVARGLAMGAAGHGIGTAAMAGEKEAFPLAAIAMALNAAASTMLVSSPAVRRALLAVAGAPAA